MLKRMKRLLRLRNKSGFTLVEVIIACALLGILVIGVLGFATPVLKNVRAKEQNARAVMLSEAIDSYIANSIQYAFYVQTFSECTVRDTSPSSGDPNVLSMKYAGKEFEKQQGRGLSDMLNCLKNDLAGEVYEIRCIGVRWVTASNFGDKKLVITNEKVDQDTGKLDPSKSQLVFDTVFYDGLYPIIRFENYNNQYQLKDESGALKDQVKPEDVDIAPGLRIVTDVYLSPDCYNIKENVRSRAVMTFSGMTYADLPNIRSNLLNKGVYKIQPNINVHYTVDGTGDVIPSYMSAYLYDSSHSSYSDGGETYYYPESFIYYIARKTKTGSDPAT